MVVFKDHAPNVAATIIILSTISIIVFPLRVYTRLKHRSWGRDDWCMSIAVVRMISLNTTCLTTVLLRQMALLTNDGTQKIPYAALTVFCLGSSFLGVGVHKEHLDEHHTQIAMMWFFFFECFFCLAIIPVKLSIAFMLMVRSSCPPIPSPNHPRNAADKIPYSASPPPITAQSTTPYYGACPPSSSS